MNRGIIQVYTGDGKGKTTAAVGQALRAWGRGLKVIIYQWIKHEGGSGELRGLLALSPQILVNHLGPKGFIINRALTPAEIEQAKEDWNRLRDVIFSGMYDLIVIDELSHAINTGLVNAEMILAALVNKPEGVELVLTGRDMPEPILQVADLVTEMKMVKHPYITGLKAREGIEY